jgi:adenine-specific DNA-methyltransferase
MLSFRDDQAESSRPVDPGLLRETGDFRRRVESRRLKVSGSLGEGRASLGQVFTPLNAADLLVEMIQPRADFRLLDPGAGTGSLTAAAVCRWLSSPGPEEMEVVAYELDHALVPHLMETLREAESLASSFGRTLRYEVRPVNFILNPPDVEEATVVVMNPPYRKLAGASPERKALERLDQPVRVPNLYAAFMVRGIRSLGAGGQMVAITPRSFANGPYFRDLRADLLARASFDQVHTFTARNRVFSDAAVLQENIIFSMRAGVDPGPVSVTSSRDATGGSETWTAPNEQIVHPGDPQSFVRLPLNEEATAVAEAILNLPCSLEDLGLSVSTGRVVDFRAKSFLRPGPEGGTVPLVYPQNLCDGTVSWPREGRKAQGLIWDTETAGLLLPNEHYVLVKRFTSKEEARRVVAALSSPRDFGPVDYVAFENHLNVFHVRGRGLEETLATGLRNYLNSRLVDEFVRQFSGHTQINATDLRELRYPSVADLRRLASEEATVGSIVARKQESCAAAA